MNAKLRIAALLPLLGLTGTWIFFLGAQAVENLNTAYMPGWSDVTKPYYPVYLFLGGIAFAGLCSSVAYQLADAENVAGKSPVARSVFRFASLAVILSLVAGAVFALGTFMNSFGSNPWDGRSKFLDVYLPIILDTLIVVYVLLRATVFRKSESVEGEPKDPRKRALGLAYSVPVIGTAIALIVGLIAYGDGVNPIETWVWVFIQAIIGASILLGTHFAVAARSAVTVAPKERIVGAGALNLNFVLSVVFGAVVTIMAFTYGMSAVADRAMWNNEHGMHTELMPLDAQWWMDKFVPALALLVLAEVTIYLTLVSRNRKEK